MTGELTRQVAAYVADVDYHALPKDVVDKTKLLILDSVGCMIGGSCQPPGRALTNYLAQSSGRAESTVFGTRQRFARQDAAHANAHAGSMLSLDDSFVRKGHPGSSIISAALAVGEATACPGTDLIAGIVAGYEMSLRLGLSIAASTARDKQVKGYATWQIYGAASAASRIYGLDTVAVMDAFGIAATHAPLPFLRKFQSRPMNWLKNNYGWAAKGGITAVDLAVHGFNGNRTIFDGDQGFWAMAGSDRFDSGLLVDGFGERFLVREVGFKPYASCRWIHTTVDAMRRLRAESGVTPDNLKYLEIDTVAEFTTDLNGDWPTTTLEAIFHIPYNAALELSGRSTALGLDEADLADPTLRQISERITVGVLAGAEEKFYDQGLLPVRATATLGNGSKVQVEAEIPTGAPGGPAFGASQVEDKFMALSEPVIGRTQAERLRDGILSLDERPIVEALGLSQDTAWSKEVA